MGDLPNNILQECQKIVGTKISAAFPLSGGDINQAFQVNTERGRFFLKTNTAAFAGEMFRAEAAGLGILGAANQIGTPSVIGLGAEVGASFLLLEFIEPGTRPKTFWDDFGARLASLHRCTSSSFGLGHDNFIGSLRQQNCEHDTWASFYMEERLLPQLELARASSRLQASDFQSFQQFFQRLPELCPAEPPSLVHGDLWSGNFACGQDGSPVIFDPAVSYSHREMDLAMTRLFGGFDRAFYQAYEAVWPLAPGFEQRLAVYQLYYLLVHVNLFGGSYVGQMRSALRQFI
jgi:fructosamine-3-kinase